MAGAPHRLAEEVVAGEQDRHGVLGQLHRAQLCLRMPTRAHTNSGQRCSVVHTRLGRGRMIDGRFDYRQNVWGSNSDMGKDGLTRRTATKSKGIRSAAYRRFCPADADAAVTERKRDARGFEFASEN